MKILVVEDEARARASLARSLGESGYTVAVEADGEAGLARALEGGIDLMVLDVMLPKLDGFTLLQEARARGVQTPVIFLTARDALSDRLRGLEAGGGDYLVKPFAFSELLARIQNLLRRGPVDSSQVWTVDDLTVDTARRRVTRDGAKLDLTPQEFTLLELLARRAGQPVTRARISEALWDMAYAGDPNLVDAAVRRLRRKVDDPFPVKLIRTLRGVGYALGGEDA
ncbi:MAG: response regulator [Acidobacteria bacterium]|nr:response regulator [Acidobacteriota bacterium]